MIEPFRPRWPWIGGHLQTLRNQIVRPHHALPAGERLWLDLGDPKGYLEAHLTLLDGGLSPGPLTRSGALELPVKGIDPSARVAANAQVRRSAVGPGASVGSGASLIDSVVWPGARVEAGESLLRTIVTPTLRLPVPQGSDRGSA